MALRRVAAKLMKSVVAALMLISAALAFGQTSSPQTLPSASPSTAAISSADTGLRTGGRFNFDHDKTGFHLDGAHSAAKCESCHVDGILKGTPKDCVRCHTAGFKTSSVITQNGGAHVIVTPGTACDTCHISNTTFRTWRMQHSATTAACSTCHSGQSFEGVVPTTKTPNHIQTTSDCSVCHGSQTSFAVSVIGFDHTGITGNCANCHNGAQAQGKPIGHLPTSLPCEQCHKPVPASTTSFKIWMMDHTGITSNCASCHNGQTFLGATPMFKPGGHIPTTLPCETCHTSTQVPGGFAFAKASFDHVANNVQPGTCTSCHNGTSAIGQIVGHMPTNPGTQCDACHSITAASFATWTMNHSKVSSTCSTCHAAGKSFIGATMVTLPTGAAHIPTAKECSTCHSSTVVPGGFATWTMNHTGIVNNCASCHNTGSPYPGVLTKPPPPGHIPTSASCETCHNAARTSSGNFANSWTMNHTGIATGCDTCHDTTVTGFGTLTVPTPGVTACESCHSPSRTNVGGFVLAITGMNHTGIVNNCAQCHGRVNSGIAYKDMTPVFQPTNHVATAQDCSACHISTLIPGGFALAASSFDHVKAGVQPGTCTACHNGTTATGQIGGHIVTNGGVQCDACHSYTLGSFSRWTMDHSKVSASCTACHSAGNSFPGATMVTVGTVTHFPVAAVQCSACHSSQTVPGGFKTSTMDHSQVTGTACATCHNTGLSFTGAVPVVTKPASGHILTTAACDQCHSSTLIPGGFKTWTMNHTAVVATPCATCHNTGVSFLAGTPPLVTKPVGAAHIPTTAACSNCHTSTTVTGGFAIWTMDHTGIVSGCNRCHGTTVALYPGVVNQPVGHQNTGTQDCSVCHTNTSIGGFAMATGGVNPHTVTPPSPTCTNCHGNAAAVFPNIPAPGQPGGHIVTLPGAQCGTCHSSSAPSFAGSTMNHSAVNTATCANCHGAGKSFTGVMTTPLITISSVTHIPVTADCSTCHSTTTVTGGFKTWTMNHSGVNTANCGTCHGATAGSFTNTAGLPIKTKTSVTHIPVIGDCSVCHSNTTVTGGFSSWTMNHSGVTTTPCATCHSVGAAGSFTNTSGTPIKSNAAPTVHIAITGDCSVCHSSTTVPGGFASWIMNHSGVNTAPCTSCHLNAGSYTNTSGKPFVVKPGNHIPVIGDCSVCHGTSYVSFVIPAPYSSMVHVGGVSTATCKTCHGDTAPVTSYNITPLAKTSFPAHIAINNADCWSCHNSYLVPGGFASATGGHVHSAADTGQCYACHASGSAGAGNPNPQIAGHIPTGATSCDACHSYSALSFATPVSMNHTVVSGTPCSTCHLQSGNQTIGTSSLATVLGKPPTHILTTAQCNTCHTSQVVPGGFKIWTMNHSGVNTATCVNCHGNVTFATGIVPVFKPLNHLTTSNDCYVCHSSTTTFVTGSMSHVGISVGCQNCHAGQTYANVTPVTQPVNHILTNGGKTIDCSVCHSNTATFTVWVMNHSGVSIATCNNCHGGQTFATGKTPVTKAGNHITTVKDCVTCHSGTTVFVGGRMGTTEHIANGNNVAGTCNSCHNGQSFQGVTPVAKPGNHIVTTQDCSICHSLTNFTTFAGTWTMNHTGITLNCMSCHNGQSFATGVVPVNKTNTPSPGHVPTAADCSNCHSATTPGGFAVKTANLSAKHTAVYLTGYSSTCYPTCHGTTSAIWFGVEYQALKTVSDHNPLGTKTNCRSCHNATDSNW
jgi:hypothetical protein